MGASMYMTDRRLINEQRRAEELKTAISALQSVGISISDTGIFVDGQHITFSQARKSGWNQFFYERDNKFILNTKSINTYVARRQLEKRANKYKESLGIQSQQPTAGDLIRNIRETGNADIDRLIGIFPSIKEEITNQDKILEYEKANNLISIDTTSWKPASIGEKPVYFQQQQTSRIAPYAPLILGAILLIGVMKK